MNPAEPFSYVKLGMHSSLKNQGFSFLFYSNRAKDFTAHLLPLIAFQTYTMVFTFSHSNIQDFENKNNQQVFTVFVFLISLSRCILLSKCSCTEHITRRNKTHPKNLVCLTTRRDFSSSYS